MDPVGTVNCIHDIMECGRFDVQCVLLDGDSKSIESIKQLKINLKSTVALHKKYPHFAYICEGCDREFCIGHIAKGYHKQIGKSVAKWKKENKLKKLAKGCSVLAISKYMKTVFHNVMTAHYAHDSMRRKTLKSIFDHLDINSNHKSTFCQNRNCKDPTRTLFLPSSLAKYLKMETGRFYSNQFMDHLKLLGTVNKCESLNQSMATLQPKYLFRKREESYDVYSYLTALKNNHGCIVFVDILNEMNFPKSVIPLILIEHWKRLDDSKTNKRAYFNEKEQKKRRTYLKGKRKKDSHDRQKNNKNSTGNYITNVYRTKENWQ